MEGRQETRQQGCMGWAGLTASMRRTESISCHYGFMGGKGGVEGREVGDWKSQGSVREASGRGACVIEDITSGRLRL